MFKRPILFILASVLIVACDNDDPVGPITDIKFSQHIQPILNEYTGILSDANVLPEGLQMDSWDNLIKGWERGEVVIPFDSSGSLLIELSTKLDYADKLSQDKLDLLKRWIHEGAQNDAREIPYENSTNLLYVCNQDAAKIYIIDTEALVVIRSIDLQDLGYPINANPHHIVFEPDGSAWYLSLIGVSKILKFSDENELLAEADMEDPALLAAPVNNDFLYISRFPQAPAPVPERIGVIERATMTVMPEIPVRPTPHAMAADHAGEFVYTCSLSESRLLVIDAASNELAEDIGLGVSKGPIQLAVSPDDQTLYVSAQISGEMFVVDVSDPSSRTIVNTIPVNASPWHPIFTPDGSKVYVGNLGANTVSAINHGTGTVSTIGAGTGPDGISQPHGIAVTNDGQFVFVSNRNTNGNYSPRFDFGDNDLIGTVAVINTADNSIHKIIEVEEFASGLAVREE